MPLDTLVTGRIATFAGASGFGWVEAVGIRDGKVAFAGSAIELETRADPHTLRIELEPGEIAMPGIIDAHMHFTQAALASQEVELTAARSIDDALEYIAEAARRIPAPGWILGGGWDQRRFGGVADRGRARVRGAGPADRPPGLRSPRPMDFQRRARARRYRRLVPRS